MTAQRDLERLLEQAREEGQEAGRSEKSAKLADRETTAALLGYFGEALETLGKRASATGKEALDEAAAVLRDGEKSVREEIRAATRKKKKSG